MKLRKSMLWSGWLAALAVAVIAVGWWYRQHERCAGCRLIPGGDGGAWPTASPADEKLAPEVATRAVEYARRRGATLLVARHGHLLLASGPGATDADWRQGSRALFAPLPPLFEHGDDGATALARELWQPLNAAEARLRCRGAERELRECRLWARPADWLRVGQLLLEHGSFEGVQVVERARVDALLSSGSTPPGPFVGARAAQGMEPLVDAQGLMVRGEGATRLWLAPSVSLVVLLVDDHDAGPSDDETELPNLLIRGLLDRPQAHAAAADADAESPAQLAPGH